MQVLFTDVIHRIIIIMLVMCYPHQLTFQQQIKLL